ncbi:cell division initiation protein [Streptomyces daliensis]|uniref:Cell division initiation protein n=1 Tax=Streptomyces daliensis TaxID=299421 RepID=A0A8T4IR52_9ACTN|nr:cell division initiation protein [Streptomyces daliensis]
MDVQQKLDEIVAAVDGARSMPMSASCVVNRAELLALLDEVREALPGSLAQAQELLGGRERMVADAQAEAQRIIESAQAERGSLVSGTEVARRAQEEADRILAEARQEAQEIRTEADDYVDSKLANFEVVLSKTIGSVERGREKLLGSGPGSEEWSEEYAQDAPERTADPNELRQRADAYVDARLGSVSAVLSKTLEAVGRGRQKLLGHQPSDELGAHLLDPDGAGGQVHTSDADFLAGLAASPADRVHSHDEAEPHGRQQPPYQPQPDHQPHVPPQPDHQPAQPAMAEATDPYAAQHVQHPQQVQQVPQDFQQHQDGYYYPQDFPQQDPYGYQQDPYYGQQQDPYYAQQPQGYDQHQQQYAQGFQQHYAPEQQAHQGHPQQVQQQPQLDETSLFDTSMIDLEQVRQYEERYGQGGR